MTSANKPMSDVNGHRCTRGGCGAPLATHEDQESHNMLHHLGAFDKYSGSGDLVPGYAESPEGKADAKDQLGWKYSKP